MEKKFQKGQQVVIAEAHNQFTAGEAYHVADVNRIQGLYHIILAKQGKIFGAIPQTKLKAA